MKMVSLGLLRALNVKRNKPTPQGSALNSTPYPVEMADKTMRQQVYLSFLIRQLCVLSENLQCT